MIKIYSKEDVWFKFISWEFLVIAQIIFNEYTKENITPVVTSACDGDHMLGSLHYVGLAWDWRIWGLYNPQAIADVIRIKAQEADYHYDVVFGDSKHLDHIHTEYDLNKTQII